jgi:hypothetical protein
MKEKFKRRLERKICDILSAVALFCDGRGFFRISNLYTFPYSEIFYIEVEKSSELNYNIVLRESGKKILETALTYNLFQKDIPFQKVYTTTEFAITEEYTKINGLMSLLKKLKRR